MIDPRHRLPPLLAAMACLGLPSALAAEWSNTELHLAYGTLDIPTFAGGGDADHLVSTLQHASGWKYGDSFFFLDVLDARRPGFQDFDLYGEWTSSFSLRKIAGRDPGDGIVGDLGFLAGANWAADANVRKYVAGGRLSLNLPGFAFANLDVAAYLDDSEGAGSGGAPAEDHSILVDFNFARPFELGGARFSVEGHVEYVGEREDEFGRRVSPWLLAQPQIRWHAGEHLAIGIEYQLWINKLGDADTDENTVQALVVWKL